MSGREPDEPEFCEAHLERAGAKVLAFRLGLCRDCWSGMPIGGCRSGGVQSEELRQKRSEAMRERRKNPAFIMRWRASMQRRRQCKAAGVAFFMKQICNSKGRPIPMEEWPEDLRVREMPE